MRAPRRPRQQALPISNWGGKRAKAGRKKRRDETVPHVGRPALADRHPVHVTLRLRRDVWQLRSKRCFRTIERALHALKERAGIGFVHYSVQGNHIHLIAEAHDRRALSRGIQALTIRIAKGLNRVMSRHGKVFAERYHEHVLKTPFEAHRAIGYVLRNHARHTAKWGRSIPAQVDPYSSGAYFDGFLVEPVLRETACSQGPPPISSPGTWLLSEGWKKHGLIDLAQRA